MFRSDPFSPIGFGGDFLGGYVLDYVWHGDGDTPDQSAPPFARYTKTQERGMERLNQDALDWLGPLESFIDVRLINSPPEIGEIWAPRAQLMVDFSLNGEGGPNPDPFIKGDATRSNTGYDFYSARPDRTVVIDGNTYDVYKDPDGKEWIRQQGDSWHDSNTDEDVVIVHPLKPYVPTSSESVSVEPPGNAAVTTSPPAAPIGSNTGYPIVPPPRTSDDPSVIRLDVSPEELRNLRANREALAPIEKEFEREANTGVHSKPVVSPNTDPASLRVGWVGGTDEHSVFPQTQTVPDTGSNVFNYGLGALYSLANLAKTLNNIPFSIIGGVNKELDRHGIPLEALPFDAAPALLAEQAEYLAARTSSLKLPIPILATGGGFGFVPLRIGGRSFALRPTPRPPKGLEQLLTDRLQGITDEAAAAARANPSAFLGYNTSRTEPWRLRFEIGHVIEGRVGQQVARDPVLFTLIEPIPYAEQAAGRGLLGDFRLKVPYQSWGFNEWDVTTVGGAWRKLQRGAVRNWLTY